VAVWVPQTRNAEGTTDLLITNLVSSATQADGINLHGRVARAVVEHTYIENTGDDVYALWGAALYPTNVTFQHSVAVNPGILRPNWYEHTRREERAEERRREKKRERARSSIFEYCSYLSSSWM
jgi:hypothetical protein